MRALAIALAPLVAATAIASAEPPAREAVEAILMRAGLERAAMRACAANERDSEAETVLTRSWRLDLTESWDVLRKAGYPEGDVRGYLDRFDLDKMTPQFRAPEGLSAFCATLGDWRKRFALLLVVLPQLELRKLLQK